MTMKPVPRMAVMSLCLAASAIASAQEEVDANYRLFTAPVTVSATGQPTIGRISGVQGQLAEVVRSQLAILQYVPARRDGIAVDHTTHINGSAVLTPMPDGTFDVRLGSVTLEPKLYAVRTPRYPSWLLRTSGTVEIVVRVDADGRIKDVRTVSSSNGDFDKAVRQAVRKWHFEPRAGDDDVEVAIPVWFHTRSDGADLPKFQCELDPRRAHIAGQDGCLDILAIVLDR